MTTFTALMMIFGICAGMFALLAVGTVVADFIMPLIEFKIMDDKATGKVGRWAKATAVAHVLLEGDYEAQVARHDD